jgi:hypothetical protein
MLVSHKRHQQFLLAAFFPFFCFFDLGNVAHDTFTEERLAILILDDCKVIGEPAIFSVLMFEPVLQGSEADIYCMGKFRNKEGWSSG